VMIMPNQKMFDPYSIAHAGSGVVARSIGLSLGKTVFIHSIFELVENQYLKFHPTIKKIFPDPSQDTLINVIGDTISIAIGWYLTDKHGGLK